MMNEQSEASETIEKESAERTDEIRNKKYYENPLGVQPLGKLLLTFSVPAIITGLISSIYNIVDQIFIGQGVGYLGNAATTVAFPVMTILLAFGTLIGSGASAYAAIRLGERKKKSAERALNNALCLTVIVGVILMVAGLIFLRPILLLFGATESVMPYAVDYVTVILIGSPFYLVSISMANLVRTDGNPRLSMWGMLIGAILNTILNPIYIFVLDMGVRGSAIATITSQILSAVILVTYFLRPSKNRPDHMRIKKEYLRLNFRLVKNFLQLGISSAITQSVACIMQIVMNNSLIYYGDRSPITGDVALGAMGIVMKIAMILGSFGIGIGIGAQPILGYNRGAQKFDRIKKTYTMAVSFASALVVAGWLICQIFPEQIIHIFGNESPQFSEFAVECLRIYLFGIFCAGFQIVSTSYFQATGQPLKASILSSLRQLTLLIPLILILPLFMGLDGILYSAPIADISSAVIVACFIIPEMKKLKRKIQEGESIRQK